VSRQWSRDELEQGGFRSGSVDRFARCAINPKRKTLHIYAQFDYLVEEWYNS